jgi:hypothetical protein
MLYNLFKDTQLEEIGIESLLFDFRSLVIFLKHIFEIITLLLFKTKMRGLLVGTATVLEAVQIPLLGQ